MATRNWNGNAQAVSDVWNATLGGTIAVGDKFRVVCSDKTFEYVTGTTTIATERTALIAAFNGLNAAQFPELKEYSASASNTAGVVTFTATVAGRPGTLSVTKVSTSGTWTITNTIPATGPNFWDNPGNWVENTVPVTGDDVVISDTTIAIMYGLVQSGVTLATLTTSATARNQIGLPRVNGGNGGNGAYSEYRTPELSIGITLGKIGDGSSGLGSSFIRINTGTVKTVLTVYNTASGGNDGVPAFIWRGTHTDNEINISGGSNGIGYYGEPATVKALRVGFKANISDTTLEIGRSVTMTGTGSTYRQSGGIVKTRSGFASVEKLGGELYMNDGGAVTVKNWGGLLRWESAGATIGTLTNTGDFQRISQLASSTITNTVVMGKGSTFVDANGSIILADGFTTESCLLGEIRTLNFGPNRTYAVSGTPGVLQVVSFNTVVIGSGVVPGSGGFWCSTQTEPTPSAPTATGYSATDLTLYEIAPPGANTPTPGATAGAGGSIVIKTGTGGNATDGGSGTGGDGGSFIIDIGGGGTGVDGSGNQGAFKIQQAGTDFIVLAGGSFTVSSGLIIVGMTECQGQLQSDFSALFMGANPSTIPVTIQGKASQSVDMVEIINLAGGLLYSHDKVGRPKYTGTSLTTTIAAGTGGGTSPSGVTVTGNDMGGRITITTGTTPAANATILTVTFSTAFAAAPKAVIVVPANPATFLLNGVTMPGVKSGDITTTTFKLNSGSTGLTAATNYEWWFWVVP